MSAERMLAVRVHKYGGPQVLMLDEVAIPAPAPDEVRIEVEYAGVNFTDTYRRAGFYPAALPFVAGVEAVGTVDAVGAEVRDVRVGDRVGFPHSPGAYAERVVVGSRQVARIPEGVAWDVACGLMMQGLTAHYLTDSTFHARPGSTVLVLAAAGGVGRLLVQIARLRGAQVIGVVSSEEKAVIAREAGADHVLVAPEDQLARQVVELSGGRGVDAAFDGVGRATYRQSMAAVRPRGTLVLFGQASGAVPAFDTLDLAERSLFLTRPRLHPHIDTPEELRARSRDLFRWWGSGALSVRIDDEFPLAEAAAAHTRLESGSAIGKVLLRPTCRQG